MGHLIMNARSRKRAYVLIAVLGLAVIVSAMGLTFIESYGMSIPSAWNQRDAVRAKYVAESGVALAMRYLMFPPLKDGNPMPMDAFFSGTNCMVEDEGQDYAQVTVNRPDEASKYLYRITSMGLAHDENGAIRAKREIVADVIVPETGKWAFPHALVNRTFLEVPSGVSITGGLRANGNVDLYNGSTYTGSLWSTGTIRQQTVLWTNLCSPNLAPSVIKCNQPEYLVPTWEVSKYQNYRLNGRFYTAYEYNKSTLNKADADALNVILDDNLSTNPGRLVVYTGGNLNLRANIGAVSLNGALVVPNGRLEFQDSGVYQISAVLDFPALALGDDLRVNADDANVTIHGSVLCEGSVDLRGKRRATLNINGTLIKTGPFANIRTGADAGAVSLTRDVARSQFWDLDSPSYPITVLNWKGN